MHRRWQFGRARVLSMLVTGAALGAACSSQIDGAPRGTTGTGGASGAGASAGGAPGGDGGPAAGGAPGSDGAPVDATTPGQPGADAAPETGGADPTCVTMGAELCDDFESGQLDTQRWTMNKPSASASITVDDLHAHGGKYAVHIKVVPNQQSTAMISEAVTFPAPSNSFYARMFVYFSPEIPVAAGADFHTGFLFGTGKNDRGDVQAGLGMIASAKQWLGYSIFFGGPKLEFGPWSKTRIAANQWQCVELFENGSDPKTEIRQIWVDDVELTDLRSDSAMSAGGNPNHLPPKFAGVSFGLWEYHPIPTLSDMWIDDIRVS
ncbi:MAG TPA: hypothetical protein VMU50_11690, partial [Polyangia bacterium]|nr:hypothetical protein [Polyangia bacterium]